MPVTSLTIKNGQIETKTYYDIDFEEKEYGFEELVNKIGETMQDSVKHHMIADVEVRFILIIRGRLIIFSYTCKTR